MGGEDKKIWEDPDPRVQWALKILDDEGFKESALTSDIFYPLLGLSTFTAASLVRNMSMRAPLGTSLHITLGLAAVGLLGGIKFRDVVSQRRADSLAVCKHYIMLHPEKFPEPERKKFGDREVFLSWRPNR